MKEITTEELKELMESEKKFVMVDCRSRESYEKEHIPGAVQMGWREVGEKAESLIPRKDMTVVTYCYGLTCDASLKCYSELQKAGYTNVREYAEGITGWKARGNEVE